MPPVKRIKPGTWAVRSDAEPTVASSLIDVLTGETLIPCRYNLPSFVLKRLADLHNGLLGVETPTQRWPEQDWYAGLPQILSAVTDFGPLTSPPNLVFVTLNRSGHGLAGPSRHLHDAYIPPEYGSTIHLCGSDAADSILLYEVRAGVWFKVAK